MNNHRRPQLGSSMIEVLVALIILAIGLLGAMSMQTRGLNSLQQSEFTTDVVLLADDMINRILAHEDAVAGVYDNIEVDTAPVGACVNNCATVQANTDEWAQALINSRLPGVVGNVDWAAPVYTVTIRWDQDRRGLAADTLADDCADNNPAATLSCYQMQVQQ